MKPKIFQSDKQEQAADPLSSQPLPVKGLNLSGKNLLITGATQGIGHALAIAAAMAGAQTILLDKSIPALEALYETLMNLSTIKSEPFLLPVDLAGATLDDYLEIAEILCHEIPHLDAIIHNAAHFGGLYALLQTPPEDLIRQVQVNYTAPIWLTQAMFSLLQAAPQPTVLFADHQESHATDSAYYNSYAGSKLALMQAVKQLALENENNQLFAYGYNSGWVNTVLARQAFPHGCSSWQQADDPELAGQILTLLHRQYPNGSVVNFPPKNK